MINPEIGDLFYIDDLPERNPQGHKFMDWVVEANGNKERLFMILEDGYSWDFERERRVHVPATYYWYKRVG